MLSFLNVIILATVDYCVILSEFSDLCFGYHFIGVQNQKAYNNNNSTFNASLVSLSMAILPSFVIDRVFSCLTSYRLQPILLYASSFQEF